MILEIYGWIGILSGLLTYVLISSGKLKPGLAYQWINLATCIVIGSYSFVKHTYPFVGLNVVWGGIAILALAKIYRKH